jgi:hypothetical protein
MPGAVKITLYNDGVSGEDMPLTINNEDITGNASPLLYIQRLEKVLHLLKPDIRFDAAYPAWVISKDPDFQVENGVVWSIDKMLPVNLGGKPKSNPESGTREVKPRLRKDVYLDDGTALRVYAQRFTVFYRFDIFAKNPQEAEELTDWFQFAFMDHFGGLFGSHYTVFRQRLKDKEVDKLNQTFNVRSLEYTVDLERHTAIPADLIDVIKIKVSDSTE